MMKDWLVLLMLIPERECVSKMNMQRAPMLNNLIVKTLRIQNFKSFVGRHLFEFDRQSGLYFITGRNLVEPELESNGAGKTTLFDALYWCWTGRTLRIQRPGTSVESFIIDALVKVSNVLVKDGTEYSIERTRKPNALTINGRAVEQTEVYKLIGLSEETIKRTFLIPQFGLLFLDLRAEEQSRLFTEVLNLDLWLKASTTANDLSTRAEKELRGLENDLAKATGRFEQTKQVYDRELILSKEFAQKHKNELQLLENLIVEEQTNLEAAETKRQVARAGLAYADTTSAALAEPDLININTRLMQALQSVKFDLVQRDKEKSRVTIQLNKYQKAKICPECGQKITEKHASTKIAELKTELTSLDSFIKAINDKQKEITVKLDKSNDQVAIFKKDQRAKQEILAKIQSEVNTTEFKVQLIEERLKNVKRQLKSRKLVMNPHKATLAELTKQYNELKRAIEDTKGFIASIQTEIGHYQYWTQAYKEIRLALIDETLLELELVTNKHAETLGLTDWNIKFATERQTVVGNTSHSFSVFIYPPDQQEPITWEALSGGESTRWQLACTFGLAEVLLSRCGVTPNIEVLDEPTKHLSQSGIDDLLDCLKERALNLDRSIYFIDHRLLDSGYFDKVICVEKTEAGSRIIQ